MKSFLLPDPGEGLVEADIVSWKVAEGDRVEVNDVIVEIETSKSLVELPVPWSGIVARLLVKEGDTVAVGAPIVVIADESDATDDHEDAPSTLVGYGPRDESGTVRRRRRAPAGDQPSSHGAGQSLPGSAALPQDGAPPASAPASTSGPNRDGTRPASTDTSPDGPAAPSHPAGAERPLASPAVRGLARELGIDLAAVRPTGGNGQVTAADLAAFVTPSAPSSGPSHTPVTALPIASGPDDERVPIRGVRKASAEAVTRSAFTAPHVTAWSTVDVTALMELVAALKSNPRFADVRITPTLIVAKVMCRALSTHRDLNAVWDEASQEIVYRRSVNLGFAAATPRGLLVPVIRDAQDLSLHGLALAIAEMTVRAREGLTQVAETTGGTFTITNVGVFGIDAGTPILYPGQSGILAVGAISRRPWVVGTGADERIVPRSVTTLAVSFDHRVVDGEAGANFLADIARSLADPMLALLA